MNLGIGQKVFIIKYTKLGLPYIVQARVGRKEWWRSSNSKIPIYYDLQTLNSGKPILQFGSGNWHYSEIYTDKSDLENRLIPEIISKRMKYDK